MNINRMKRATRTLIKCLGGGSERVDKSGRPVL